MVGKYCPGLLSSFKTAWGMSAPKSRNYLATLPLRTPHRFACTEEQGIREYLFFSQRLCWLCVTSAPPLPWLTACTLTEAAHPCPMQCLWKWLCPLLKSFSALSAMQQSAGAVAGGKCLQCLCSDASRNCQCRSGQRSIKPGILSLRITEKRGWKDLERSFNPCLSPKADSAIPVLHLTKVFGNLS